MNISITTNDPLANLRVEDQPKHIAPIFTDHVEEEDQEEREYRVRVTRRVEILEECYVYLDACSEDDAITRVSDDIYGYCDQWDFVETLDSYDEEVDEVEEQ